MQQLVRQPCTTRGRPARPLRCTPCRASTKKIVCSTVGPGSKVLVAGSTGGVGQLLTAKLLERGYNVTVLARNPDKVKRLFGESDKLKVVEADLRDASSLTGAFEGVDAVCCTTGTTAFPSTRWEGNNGPRPTDYDAVINLINAVPRNIKRFVFVTSCGVERQKQLPWCILNTFGVLHYKRLSEQHLEASGLPFTILRPNRLTDGPYTSYDLNTLLQATSGSRQEVELAKGDCLGRGEASRIAVAEAMIQILTNDATVNQTYCMGSAEGEGPGQDPVKWSELFAACTEVPTLTKSTA